MECLSIAQPDSAGIIKGGFLSDLALRPSIKGLTPLEAAQQGAAA